MPRPRRTFRGQRGRAFLPQLHRQAIVLLPERNQFDSQAPAGVIPHEMIGKKNDRSPEPERLGAIVSSQRFQQERPGPDFLGRRHPHFPEDGVDIPANIRKGTVANGSFRIESVYPLGPRGRTVRARAGQNARHQERYRKPTREKESHWSPMAAEPSRRTARDFNALRPYLTIGLLFYIGGHLALRRVRLV
jgi:hypothetical protein